MVRPKKEVIEFVCPICRKAIMREVTPVFPQTSKRPFCTDCLKTCRPEESRVMEWEKKWGLVEERCMSKK